ncbi:MAG: Uma2 family endonuclease [Myxococcales bacterium]|nr:Uma2 family endonuclease [Myxococcales bacterium]
MSGHPRWNDPPGPWRADQIREGEPYELSNGHRIECMGAGERHSRAHAAGALVLATAAPSPDQTGIDLGVAWNDGKNLRAPDLVAGVTLKKNGWSSEAPPLAVEYASVGQNEDELKRKIAELLDFGTRIIWVVRLVGPLRVEIHEKDAGVRIVDADAVLTAPGILEYDVPARALIDPDIAVEAALHNTLARKGYRDLDAVRSEGHQEGHEEGHQEGVLAGLKQALRIQLTARGWTTPPELAARITACTDLPTLTRWITQCATAGDVEAALR